MESSHEMKEETEAKLMLCKPSADLMSAEDPSLPPGGQTDQSLYHKLNQASTTASKIMGTAKSLRKQRRTQEKILEIYNQPYA